MKEIFERVSIRKYQNRPIEKEKIELLMRAAMAAPTAGNQQEWEFILIDDPAICEKLSTVSPYSGPCSGAPLVIVALGNLTSLRHPGIWEQDISAACENILLEAVALGLGAVWMGIDPSKERMANVAAIFELPEHVVPFALISVGYPDESRPWHDRYDAKKVHWNKY